MRKGFAIRRFILPILSLLILLPEASSGFAQQPARKTKDIEREISAEFSEAEVSGTEPFIQTISAELRETKTPGAAIVVIKDNRIIFSRGFGTANAETSVPVTTETLFHIGSLTKMMTAAALISLADEGKIDLNAPVSSYLQNLSPKIATLTLHQLLSQTSGLRDAPGESGTRDEKALAEFAQSLTEKDLFFEPGKYFSYSNAGFALAGAVLEKVSGKFYAATMGERIFAPLAMSRTTFRTELAMTYPLAVGHTIGKDGKPQVVRPFDVNASLAPAGYAFSNVADFANFVRAVLGRGNFKGEEIFPAKTVSRLLTPHSAIPTNVFAGGNYGYGLFLQDYRGYRVAEHGGTQPGFSSEMKIVPEKNFAVVVFANRDGVRLNKTFARAFELFLPSVKQAPKDKAAASLPMSEAEMQTYVGTYSNRWAMEVFVRDGKLFLRRFGTELPITRIGNNRFFVMPAPNAPAQEFTIDLNDHGKAEALRMLIWAFKKQ